jgi:prepilin-type N-terminal cleavage/methylation domain-containing protein
VRRGERGDHGFTLIELLIVIVVLGVLATVVVFAVGGIVGRGEESAQLTDERTLVTAQESYYALNGEYAAEAALVSAGLLRDESDVHDITIAPDASTYTVVPAADPTPPGGGDPGGGDPGGGDPGGGDPGGGDPGGGDPPPPPPPPTPVAVQYSGYDSLSLGTGSKKLVIIGSGSTAASTLFANLQTTPLVDTQVIWVQTDDVDETDDVDALVAAGADYFVAAQAHQIRVSGSGSNDTYVGAYMASRWAWPTFFWWTQNMGIPSTAALQARVDA